MVEKRLIKVTKNATEKLTDTEFKYLLSKKSLTTKEISKLIGCSEKDATLLAIYMVCSSSGYKAKRVRTGVFIRSIIEVYDIPRLRKKFEDSIFIFWCPDIDILKEFFEFVEVDYLDECN